MRDVLRPVRVVVEFDFAMYATGPVRASQSVDIPPQLREELIQAVGKWAASLNGAFGNMTIQGKEIE